ncbi:MAG TPA: pyruvate kinase [Thermoanaerobaculia bacterium]|nr:pyruvate kinase [Thermoanaerobaculia bacterium]
MMRRAKILATLGPVSNTEPAIRALVEAGADAFRLNFSHGTHEEHARIITIVRDLARTTSRFIPIVADIQGPKIRIGEMAAPVVLEPGSEIVFTTEPILGTATSIPTRFDDLPREVRPGDRILINDGLVETVVLAIESETRVRCRVVHGGVVESKKGMNFPDTDLRIPAITEKDRADLAFAVEHQVDYVAASFIRRRDDVVEIRSLLRELGGAEIDLIAKIEKAHAVEALESILEVSDGVMVARGDLGVELAPEAVPIAQKRILDWASQRGRLAITATQMLESMTKNSRPTRAEASDVANAIFDGSDVAMLSAETASGSYPVESVRMMARIITAAESHPELAVQQGRDPFHQSYETDDFTDSLAGAARYAADQIDAKYVVVFTQSGFTARLMSKFRPRSPVIALTHSSWVARRMNLLWGVTPYVLKDVGDYHEQIVERVERFLVEQTLVEKGDRIVILMGSPLYERARTNLLRVHRVGERTPELPGL